MLDVRMWDVFKVRRMVMMFARNLVCGAGTKQDILYLHNVYVNNFAIYFHLYDRLKQSRARGERHPGRDGCCLVFQHDCTNQQQLHCRQASPVQSCATLPQAISETHSRYFKQILYVVIFFRTCFIFNDHV